LKEVKHFEDKKRLKMNLIFLIFQLWTVIMFQASALPDIIKIGKLNFIFLHIFMTKKGAFLIAVKMPNSRHVINLIKLVRQILQIHSWTLEYFAPDKVQVNI